MNARAATASRRDCAAWSWIGERVGAAKIRIGIAAGLFGRQRDGLQRAVVDQGVDHARRNARAARELRLAQRRARPAPPPAPAGAPPSARLGAAPVARRPMRAGSAPASSAARVAMRSTMPRGARVQAATQSRKVRSFCGKGRQIEPRADAFEIFARVAAQAPDDADRPCGRPSETSTKSPSAERQPVRNAIGIGLIDRDRDQHIGDRLGAVGLIPFAALSHGAIRVRSLASHVVSRGSRRQASTPWQCLYFLPDPQGQGSLRPTRPQLSGLFGSRSGAGSPPAERLRREFASGDAAR